MKDSFLDLLGALAYTCLRTPTSTFPPNDDVWVGNRTCKGRAYSTLRWAREAASAARPEGGAGFVNAAREEGGRGAFGAVGGARASLLV